MSSLNSSHDPIESLEAAISTSSILMTSPSISSFTSTTPLGIGSITDNITTTKYAVSFSRNRSNLSMKVPSTKTWRIAAVEDVSALADPAPVALTWQIVVGAIAGVTPFVVAGIEFSKRIIAQRQCEVCGGSGLVLTKEYYVKCPGCGGFLPWQSWKRFFSG